MTVKQINHDCYRDEAITEKGIGKHHKNPNRTISHRKKRTDLSAKQLHLSDNGSEGNLNMESHSHNHIREQSSKTYITNERGGNVACDDDRESSSIVAGGSITIGDKW